jgi:hypothetical protein
MHDSLLAHTLLLSTAAFAGTVLGLLLFAVVRFRARHAFGSTLVRDQAARGGPFRGGLLERLVARDAPIAVRVVGALGLVAVSADAFMQVALGYVEGSVLGAGLLWCHRAEVGFAGTPTQVFSWAIHAQPGALALLAWDLLVLVLVLVADVALARGAVTLLQARTLDKRALVWLVAAALAVRGLDALAALFAPLSLPGIPGRDTIPALAPAVGFALGALASWLIVGTGDRKPTLSAPPTRAEPGDLL